MIHALVQDHAVLAAGGGDCAVPWWSFGKTVIAAAALALVRDGLLALDGAVPGRRFTLRHLLRHQAGLGEYGALPDYHAAVARGDAPWSEAEMLARADAGRLRYPPGQGWAYSNIGYLYLRRLIEDAAQESFGAALQRLVLTPLGVEGVRLALEPQDLQGVQMGSAQGYHPGWVYHGLLSGPVAQAALLLDRLLAGGLLPPDLLAAMRQPHPVGGPIAGRPWLSPGYGLGLMTGEVEGGMRVAGHTGGGPGSVIAVYRELGTVAPRCCAAFAAGADGGLAEAEAMRLLRA